MKLSEALKSGNAPLANQLLKEALARFADEMTEEHFMRREHEKYRPEDEQKRIRGNTKGELANG